MDLKRVWNDFAIAAYGILLTFVWRLVGDHSTAEDITQAAFAAVLRNLDFDPSCGPAAIKYLKKKALWLAQDRHRHLRRRPEALPAELADRGSSPPELALEREEIRERVRRGVAGLASEYREVMVRHLAGMDHEQIAVDIGVPIKVVYRRFHTAKALLARILKGAGPP